MTDVPRPEYPRPQFVRDEWSNLNGTWEFAFDDANAGLDEGWHDGRALPGRIVVPFPYQSELSGIDDKRVHPFVWYARTFDVPGAWRGRDLLLHFGAVDYRSTVWVNGHEVGNNQGGHVPFSFDIAPYVREGSNRIALRVVDEQDARQPRGKQSSTGLPHDIDYYCTTGVWQTVWLEPVPSMRIEEIRITPRAYENMVVIDVFLHAHSADWGIVAEASEQGRVVARAEEHTAVATARLHLRIPYAKLWSPDSPNLYDLSVRLYEGDALRDEVKSYVGLRSIEVRDGRVVLNGRPVYMKMVLDQGYWPESLLAAPSDEALQTDIGWAKKFGFNGVRKHQKIEDPRWLYWCDRLGMMVWEEMPNAREWSSLSEERLSSEWRRAVRRDYSHPCVVAWVPVNESMGFPGLNKHHPGQYAYIERMVSATRRLDSTRPVIDNDGWEHTDITDICAIHDYTPTGAALRERYREKLAGGELPPHVWLTDKPLFSRGSKYRGQPVVLSEVGGFLMKPQDVPPEERDMLYQFYGSVADNNELLAKYRDLMEGIASLGFLAGFCYTQLTDIEQESNGLLTYDRRPKLPPEALADLHRELFRLH